jgi:hypothetical protein
MTVFTDFYAPYLGMYIHTLNEIMRLRKGAAGMVGVRDGFSCFFQAPYF